MIRNEILMTKDNEYLLDVVRFSDKVGTDELDPSEYEILKKLMVELGQQPTVVNVLFVSMLVMREILYRDGIV